MLRLPVWSALLSAAFAQIICKDDNNFLESQPFRTGYGPDGDRTCGDWKRQHFPMALTTSAECYQPTRISLVGMEGEREMSKAELLMYMTAPVEGRKDGGSGCCGENASGSACDLIMEAMPMPPCPNQTMGVPLVEDDGTCRLCYGRVIMEDDGRLDCKHCSGIDADGCTRSECSELSTGRWNEDEDECKICSARSPHGCGAAECSGMGGFYDTFDKECRGCNGEMGDVSGCPEDRCIELGHTYRTWEDDGRERRFCLRCAPDDGDTYGCTEARCNDIGAMWDMMDQLCKLCRPEDEQLDGCSREQCTQLGFRYKTWEECREGVCEERGHCEECAPQKKMLGGCLQDQCDAIPEANWDQFDEECKGCYPSDDSIHGCSREQCGPAGGRYKTWDHCEGEGASHQCVERGYCARCAPHDGDVSGCTEAACNANDKANWNAFEQECMVCDAERNDLHGCSREQCEAANGMYKTWDHCDGAGANYSCTERGSCSACSPETMDVSGCDENRCKAAGMDDAQVIWKCTGDWCECSFCNYDNYWGCGRDSCQSVGRTWCDDSHCTDYCGSDGGGGIGGSCVMAPKSTVDAIMAHGYMPRYC